MASTPDIRATWSSRRAFLLATIGGAVGLGNLWRFPFIAGENGGGGFVLIYLGMVFLLGLPVLAGEMLLGRRGHRSAVNSINDLVKAENASGFWRVIGWGSLLVPFIALTYYAVIAAWSIDYFVLAREDGEAGREDRPVEQRRHRHGRRWRVARRSGQERGHVESGHDRSRCVVRENRGPR